MGRIKARLNTPVEQTPLQEKLDDMAAFIGKLGTGAAVATFGALMIIWAIGKAPADVELDAYIVEALIIAVTIIVVAIPEGLPLAVTISLAYSTKKLLQDQNLIRVLAACETMGNATNISPDKTGTLTENRMTVVEAWMQGEHYGQGALPKASDLKPELVSALHECIALNSKAVLTTDPVSGATKTVAARLKVPFSC